jgi:hypothetical protein
MRFVSILFLVSIFQIIQAQTVNDSLKGYYTFNESLLDFSGNSNHINQFSGTYTSDRFGNINSAFEFDGVDDSLVFPIQEFAPISKDFTISFWYKTNSSKVMNLFSSKQFPNDTTNNFEVQLNSHNLFYLQNYKQIWYQTYVYWNGSGILSNGMGEGAVGNFINGEWSYFVISRSADTLRIYRNHQLYSFSMDFNCNGALGDAVDLIFSSSPYKFKGAIDDLRFYNKALSQSEIDLLWFENKPFTFIQPKPHDAYVKGSNLLVSWEYDTSKVSDSILVQYRINRGDWITPNHTNLAYETYIYLDLTYPSGTVIEVKVSDYNNPTIFSTTGEFVISEYDWVQVSDNLPFTARDGAGLLNFKNKMWLLGGWDPPNHEPYYTENEVLSSTNGVQWNFETNAAWPARHCGAWLTNDTTMWVIGGDPQSGCLTDVWKTNNGKQWTQMVSEIPGFVNRNNPNYAILNDKLLVFGGEQCNGHGLNDVWQSSDGLHWNQIAQAPWEGRGMQLNNCVDDNGQLWLLGGANESDRRTFNDVWKTTDGITWTLVSESAPWSGRYWHTVAWFDGKIWMLGGMTPGIEMNDVWYSEDGIDWKELKSTTGNWPLATRHAQSTTVYENALWYMCGINTNNAWKIVNTNTYSPIEKPSVIPSNIYVYPNPTNGIIHIMIPNNVEKVTYEILNNNGEIVYTGTLEKDVQTINISHLPSGIYYVKNLSENKSLVQFIKY